MSGRPRAHAHNHASTSNRVGGVGVGRTGAPVSEHLPYALGVHVRLQAQQHPWGGVGAILRAWLPFSSHCHLFCGSSRPIAVCVVWRNTSYSGKTYPEERRPDSEAVTLEARGCRATASLPHAACARTSACSMGGPTGGMTPRRRLRNGCAKWLRNGVRRTVGLQHGTGHVYEERHVVAMADACGRAPC